MEFTSAIHHKSNGEAIFYPTTIVHPKPAPITNITTNFPSTAAQLEDFFQVNKINNTHSYKISFAISFSGMTDMEMYTSMKNTLKHNNLWLASDKISANTFDDIGFVENSNPVYTNSKDMEIAIEKSFSELVKKDKNAAEIYAKLKGTKFISCTLKRVHGIKAVTKAITIRNTANNYGRLLRLLGWIPEKIGSQYVIR